MSADLALFVRVTFARIGRNRAVPPLDVKAADADDLAEQIHRYARPHLLSRDVEVVVDLAEMRGTIFCGFQSGGSFTLEHRAPGGELR